MSISDNDALDIHIRRVIIATGAGPNKALDDPSVLMLAERIAKAQKRDRFRVVEGRYNAMKRAGRIRHDWWAKRWEIE